MDYRRLGNSGLLVSAVGLGTNNFGARLDLDGTRAVIDRALDRGITLIDTADVYGSGQSEEMIGACLGARRHDVVLASKFGVASGESPYKRGTSRRYMLEAVEGSLRRLRTDYIDLYQVHRPDPETPILETLQALNTLVEQGKVRYVGVSNFAGWQIMDALWTARTEHLVRPISAQSELSLLVRDALQEVLPACRAAGFGFLPYFPLASGFLTGKYRREQLPEEGRLTKTPRLAARVLTEENWQRLERLEAFAADRGMTLVQVAFGWLLAHPEVSSVIAGAMTPEQIDQNVAAASTSLQPVDLEALEAIL